MLITFLRRLLDPHSDCRHRETTLLARIQDLESSRDAAVEARIESDRAMVDRMVSIVSPAAARYFVQADLSRERIRASAAAHAAGAGPVPAETTEPRPTPDPAKEEERVSRYRHRPAEKPPRQPILTPDRAGFNRERLGPRPLTSAPSASSAAVAEALSAEPASSSEPEPDR